MIMMAAILVDYLIIANNQVDKIYKLSDFTFTKLPHTYEMYELKNQVAKLSINAILVSPIVSLALYSISRSSILRHT